MTSSEIRRTGSGAPTAEAYTQMDADPRFAWYLLYVLCSAFARGFMDTKVVGHLNVAFFFGLLQFVSTFVIAWAYSRYANSRIDPIATELHDELGGAR